MESFVVLPVITVSMPLGGLFGIMKTDTNTIPPVVLSQQYNIAAKNLLTFNQVVDEEAKQKAEMLKARADAIDAYFKAHDMPLFGTGAKMAEEADKNDLDWRLLPAIAVRESTGGKHACKSVTNSFFGWGSCKISFKSKDAAIESIARHLGGNNPNTEHHYSGKSTEAILKTYNPPSIVPQYAAQVMGIMDTLGDADLGEQPSNDKVIAMNI